MYLSPSSAPDRSPNHSNSLLSEGKKLLLESASTNSWFSGSTVLADSTMPGILWETWQKMQVFSSPTCCSIPVMWKKPVWTNCTNCTGHGPWLMSGSGRICGLTKAVAYSNHCQRSNLGSREMAGSKPRENCTDSQHLWKQFFMHNEQGADWKRLLILFTFSEFKESYPQTEGSGGISQGKHKKPQWPVGGTRCSA